MELKDITFLLYHFIGWVYALFPVVVGEIVMGKFFFLLHLRFFLFSFFFTIFFLFLSFFFFYSIAVSMDEKLYFVSKWQGGGNSSATPTGHRERWHRRLPPNAQHHHPLVPSIMPEMYALIVVGIGEMRMVMGLRAGWAGVCHVFFFFFFFWVR